jgi:hypothetical protein
MKIISHESGKITKLFDRDEVKQGSGAHISEIIQEIKNRYNFVSCSSIEAASKGPLICETGQLKSDNKNHQITSLGIYADAIAVQSVDTDSASLVMDDFTDWFSKRFDVSSPTSRPTVIYESQLVVDLKKQIEPALKAFNNVFGSFGEMIKKTYAIDLPVHQTRFYCGIDHLKLSKSFQTVFADFVLERRVNAPFEQNRFFSAAPLPTKMHIELLQNFEKAIT